MVQIDWEYDQVRFACLVVVLAGAAESAALALDALPRVLLHADDHVLRELQAGRVAYKGKKTTLSRMNEASVDFV